MFKKLRKIFSVILSKESETQEDKNNNIHFRSIVSIVLMCVSALLTIINIFTKEYLMMWTTFGLSISFVICVIVLKVFKNRVTQEILTCLSICVVFSFYALYGRNEGFAILWIVLVPAVSALFLSWQAAFAISLYFLLFLVGMFYTPLKDLCPGIGEYTKTFTIRYPVLYLAAFVLAFILATQTMYYSKIAKQNSLYDYLTDLKNRRFCSDMISQLEQNDIEPEFTIVSLDINNLKTLNDNYGHDYGDKSIVATAKILKKVFKSHTDMIYRTGGDEFLVFVNDERNEILDLIKQVKDLAAKEKIAKETLTISIGYVKGREYINAKIHELINIAENNMYKDKEEYYTRMHIDRRRKSTIRIF